MKKGFEYWSEKEYPGFAKPYWIFYALVFMIGLWTSYVHRDLIWFVFIGLIPHILLKIAYPSFDPTANIEKGLRKLEPEFLKKLEDRFEGPTGLYLFSQRKVGRQDQILTALIKWDKPEPPPRILTFMNNWKRIMDTISLSIFGWFITLFLILMVYFVRSAIKGF